MPSHHCPRQELKARVSSSEAHEAHDIIAIPTTKRQHAQVSAVEQNVGTQARSAHTYGAERVARGSDLAAPGAWACSPAIGAEHVT